MLAGEYCNRDVVIVRRDDPIREAIGLMRKHHVGNVIVVETIAGTPTPVGILTDRDIVIEILAKDIELTSVLVGDIMSDQLVSVRDDTSVAECLELMRAHGVRRVPVVDPGGALAGVLSVDDLLDVIAEQLNRIVLLIRTEQIKEQQQRP